MTKQKKRRTQHRKRYDSSFRSTEKQTFGMLRLGVGAAVGITTINAIKGLSD